MYVQNNVRVNAEENTGQNTDKGHTPSSRIEIKIPDHAGNRTRGRWVGRLGLYRPRHGNDQYDFHP